MKEKVIVIVGPTAVGKTELSLNLAKDLNGEIISGDSMQVYKELDIGTDKVTLKEREMVNHHLIDIMEIDRKSTRLNSSHVAISYAVFCLKKKILTIND